MEKINNPYAHIEGYNCIGCSPDNPIGLHLEFWADGDEVLTQWSPGENYQGWLNTLHGGIISLLMDEVANWVLLHKLHTSGFTSRLQVKFRRPVSTADPLLTVRGRLAGSVGKFHTVHLTLHNAAGELCDEGEATYYCDERFAPELQEQKDKIEPQ